LPYTGHREIKRLEGKTVLAARRNLELSMMLELYESGVTAGLKAHDNSVILERIQ